jgi:hypothetical protein
VLLNPRMTDVEVSWKQVSQWDEGEAYDPVQFDPEQTSVDDDELVDGDTMALRDAVRDILADQGRFEILFY